MHKKFLENDFYGVLEKIGEKFSLVALAERDSPQFVSVAHIAAPKRRKLILKTYLVLIYL